MPTDCVFFEAPVVALWDEEEKVWRKSGFEDVVFDEGGDVIDTAIAVVIDGTWFHVLFIDTAIAVIIDGIWFGVLFIDTDIDGIVFNPWFGFGVIVFVTAIAVVVDDTWLVVNDNSSLSLTHPLQSSSFFSLS